METFFWLLQEVILRDWLWLPLVMLVSAFVYWVIEPMVMGEMSEFRLKRSRHAVNDL